MSQIVRTKSYSSPYGSDSILYEITSCMKSEGPNKINIEESINLGILVFKPINEASDVMSIGPKNQANGILKNSAIIALGTEIIITKANSLENISLKFSLLKGIAWLFCIIHDFRIYRNW